MAPWLGQKVVEYMLSWYLNVYSHGSHAQGIKLVRHYGANTTPLEVSLVSPTVNMSLKFSIGISIEKGGNWKGMVGRFAAEFVVRPTELY